MSEKFEFKSKKEKNWLLGLLRSEVVDITFTKKDGSERIMKCTLMESKIPNEKMPKGTEKAKNDEVLPVLILKMMDGVVFVGIPFDKSILQLEDRYGR